MPQWRFGNRWYSKRPFCLVDFVLFFSENLLRFREQALVFQGHMKAHVIGWWRRTLLLVALILLPSLGRADLLLNVDFGGGSVTKESGPAAIGHTSTDFWNYYTRNGADGSWLTFGVLTNLLSAEQVATATGLTIANAPGAWGNGSSDDMYDSYDYPFDGGNVTVTITNLDAGAYDVYVYGIDSSYEIAVGGLSYGLQPLPNGPVTNPVVWQEGLQYVAFRSVHVTNEAMTLTVRPGQGGYATISGLQIAAVTPTNHPPVVKNQTLYLPQDSMLPIMLTGTDLDGDPLTFSVTVPPLNGTLSGAAPNLTYTPDPGFTGVDTFNFTANDGQADSAPATITLNVMATNAATLLNIDFGGGSSTSEVGPAATGHSPGDFWNYYTRNDGHGGWLTFGSLTHLKTAEGLSTPTGLTIANAPGAWGNGSADDMYNSYDYPFNGGNVTVVVTNLSSGAYDFYVYGIDSRYELSQAGLSYGIKPLPNGPVTNPVVWQEGLQYVAFRSVRVTNGTPVTLTVRPGAGGYATIAGMQIEAVTPTNHPPVATGQSLNLMQGGSVPVTLTGSDLDGDPLTYAVATQPAHGNLAGTAPNLTYTPDPVFSGNDSFTFTVNDGQVDSSPATVAITVVSTNHLVLLNIDIGAGTNTNEVGPAATGHSPADFWNFYTRDDGHGAWLTFGGLSNLMTAERIVTAAGFTISNAPGAWSDGSSDPMYDGYDYPFNGGNVTMTVTNLPSGAYDFYLYGFESSYEVTVDGLSYGIKPLPSASITNPMVWAENTNYVLFPSVLVTNGSTVTLTVRPGIGGYSIIAGLQIAGTLPTNHPPSASSQTVVVPQDGNANITLAGTDIDGDALTYRILAQPTNGTLSGSAPNLTYAPAAGYSGPDNFTFVVNDGQLDSTPATVHVTIFPKSPGALIDVDFGGGSATSEVGPAATGHSMSDFWNYYTRNDGHGGWLSFGSLSNLSTVEGEQTSAGLTIANAPGAWGNGSSDDMYNSYDYPFDGGNVTVVFTNLAAGAYDVYVYGIESSYELSVGTLSYGVKPLPGGPVVNPVVWQEGLQYVLFRSVQVTNGDNVTLTVRPGSGGYATISGMQLALKPSVTETHAVALSLPVSYAPTALTLPAADITSSTVLLSASVNPRGVPTSVWFDWGTTTNLGNSTPVQQLSAVASNLTITASLTGLTPNSTYFFRVRTTNPVGPADGVAVGFAWSSASPTLQSSINPGSHSLDLHFLAAPGEVYRVQSSNDLLNWTDLGLATETTSGSFSFSGAVSPSQGAVFYRLVAP